MPRSLLPRVLLLASVVWHSAAAQVDLRDTQKLLFVGDREQNLIAVVDPKRGERIDMIETPSAVHDLIATPYAPLLIYTNRDDRILHVFNLGSREWLKSIELPLTPRHVVLDTTGTRIGITDSVSGGFALVSAYEQRVLFHLPDVPPTADVLFAPNEIDVFYSAEGVGALGVIDTNQRRKVEVTLTEVGKAELSPPSRSLDGRYIYIANEAAGEVYAMNAYSRAIYKTFDTGDAPSRPYTTPQGLFLYLMDAESGRFVSYDQNEFRPFADIEFGSGVDLVTVGRFDRMNLFSSTRSRAYYLYDNVSMEVTQRGELQGLPLDAKGSADGTAAYVAFRDLPEVAVVSLETGAVEYLPGAPNGAGAFAIGLSNNVCH